MRYLLLIRGDESAAVHADEGCFGWSERMAERGVLQGGGGLRPPAEGKAVRIRRRQLMLSDGPFAETKEQVGGFCLIEAADLDEAVAVFREEWGRVVATLIRVTGDWDLAEECTQDAFAMALQRWPADGVPRRPG